ncbi:TonB-dependent siderophore receptor [uncultured Alistipes sp.]|uniref:TonB-dependent receptor plug domain-containing protein n=1 Tax=uncultured Alistipes sp. TaxID=538949 RepID=UPI00266644CA|nr:TonB-dependent receptor [uncultured Alistipes sp.]
MFRNVILLVLSALCTATAAAQGDATARSIDIEQVEIAASRPMKQIGVQRTLIDSTVLRENITSSLADALTTGTTIFIKSYGRATLATASFRGTAPSHTQVTWNGMKINSPMLGQVDFSLIPSYFIDDAAVFHGASSVGITGGGLGGAVTLKTSPPAEEGLSLRYVQGVGSFSTFDEFARLTWRGKRWSSSTRVLCSTSENDFRYHNYNTKQFVTDENGNIVDSYYPLQRNRGGGFRDLHVMQELYYTTRGGDRLSLAAWYLDSHRGLAMTSAERNTDKQKRNTQDERTLRAVAAWQRLRGGLKTEVRGGYTHTEMRYLMRVDVEGQGNFFSATDAQSRIRTLFAEAEAEYALGERWLFTGSLSMHQHDTRTGDLSLIDYVTGQHADTLYRKQRFEASAFAAVKWRPHPRLGLAADLRWELYGDRTTPLIPALYADYLLSRRGKVVVKASAARNYRFPTLNDLYFRPGGNPDLKPEHGWTWDAGVETALERGAHSLKASVTAFDSYIDDWILWIATAKQGIYTPVNVRRVHSYGIETKLTARTAWSNGWQALFDGNFAWTRSINRGDKFSDADRSVGKQLVYIPVYSAAFTARLLWRRWELDYKWCWYSERYTMTDNDPGVLGRVKPYFMSDLSLARSFECAWASFSLKGCIHNLLNEEYETVLSRPMPRLNVSFFLGITPKFRKR